MQDSRFDSLALRHNSYKWMDLKYEDEISLDIADMDFVLSDELLALFRKRIDLGNFGYEYEGESYYDAFIGWMKRQHDIELQREWIVTCPGSMCAVKTILNAFSDIGSGILLASPIYNAYFTAIEKNNRRKVFTVLRESDGKYTLDLEDLENKITSENVRIFILCNPHNPIGKVWSTDELKRIVEICKKHSVLIVADEVHQDFVFDHATYHSCIEYKDQYNKIIVLTSPCKTFNVAGLQIANIIIPDKDIRDAFIEEKTKRMYIAGNAISINMCEHLYRHGDKWHEECFRYIKENIDCVKQFWKTYEDVRVVESDALFLVWMDLRRLGFSDDELENMFAEEMHLRVGIGKRFGEGGEGFIRINVATPRHIVIQALSRMRDSFDRRKHN